MESIGTDKLLEALNWRYATKKFDPTRKIDTKTWAALEDALVLSPSSFGLQPWKFLVVENPETRAKLVSASWGQTQVVNASHLVVFAVKHPLTDDHVQEHMAHSANTRNEPLETLADMGKVILGFIAKPPYPLDIQAWSTRQVYIALGNFMTSAALLGIDTCPMEGLDPAAYDQILGLEGTGFSTVAACPAGYRAGDDKYAQTAKVRFPKDRVLAHLV